MSRQQKLNFGGCQFIKISSEISSEEGQVLDAVSRQKDRLKAYIVDIVKVLPDNDQFLNAELLTEAIFLLLEGTAVSSAIYKNHDSIKKAKQIAEKLLN